ncbi:MAG TPA: galactokinase family protein [Tepidisphaeraceae bacterium]|jgi:galactokinase|nr:galactokinase family protein [Tepidisphaeraceae bacterium]
MQTPSLDAGDNANGKALLLKRALAALNSAGLDAAAAKSVFVPGRIEFLGKHTDYCGGRSLLCAVERGICFTYVPRRDCVVRVLHPQTRSQIEFTLSEDVAPVAGHWSNYVMTVARRVVRNFSGELHGVDLAIHGDLPWAAGLSSSSALIVGTFMVLSEVNGLPQRPEYQQCIRSREDLAGYLGAVENGAGFTGGGATLAGDRGVGTLGGSQDHTAILCSARGELRQFGFCPVGYEGTAPMPPGYCFVVADCGVSAEKTGAARSAYNRNPFAVRRLLQTWNDATGRVDPSLAAAIRSDPSAADRMRHLVRTAPAGDVAPEWLVGRLDQFIAESERIIPATMNALRAGDLDLVGQLVDESQRLAERALGNQVPQTTFLAAAARQAGAAAASAFGAGFGGSVWALVSAADADEFRKDWLGRYRQEFPVESESALAFVTRAGDPAAEY